MEIPKIDRPDTSASFTWKQEMDRLKEIQSLRKEGGIWTDEATYHIDTGDVPFFMFHPLSDAHLGAIGSDTQAFSDHMDFIQRYPVYTATVGDMGDFFSPTHHPDGMLNDAVTPDDQLTLLRAFYEQYREKILCTVQDPSHTDWHIYHEDK